MSNWDRRLATLTLEGVSIDAASLTDAWTMFSTRYLVRSILLLSGAPPPPRPFRFRARRCSVADLWAAFASAYGLVVEQDPVSGVWWFHSADAQYDRVLPSALRVADDHLGLPMRSGIFEPIEAAGLSVTGQRWGSTFTNTFNFAVDIPAGVHTLRAILDLCCDVNPTKTFYVTLHEVRPVVTAVNIVNDQMKVVPEAALHIWDADVGWDRGRRPPPPNQVMQALASGEPAIRRAARNYLEAIIWIAEVESWIAMDVPVEARLWTCIGAASIFVRSDDATYVAGIEAMSRDATDEYLARCEPGLAVVTALELARLTKTTRALETVQQRQLASNELAAVAGDACRIAALSAFVRQTLRTPAAARLLDAIAPLARMIRSSNGERLAFTVA